MSSAIDFPPLLTGVLVAGEPFAVACEAATDAEPGTVFYAPDEAVMRAAILLAPETPLSRAISVSFVASLGLNDALGALGPPELAVHLEWPDRVRVNGALCGRLRAACSTDDPNAEPDWLVVGLEVPILSVDVDTPGEKPEETCLHEEGCGTVTSHDLIETWARHMMNWLHVYLTDGFEPLHREWLVKAHGREEGRFIGLDEHGGLILNEDGTTRIVPLTQMLESA